MKEYRTTATVDLFSGMVGLSEKQVACRSGKLKKVKGGYEILDHVQFKAGEVISFNPDKATLAKVELIGGKEEPEPEEKPVEKIPAKKAPAKKKADK